MLVILVDNADELRIQAAGIVARAIRRKADLVLGLAAGTTPLGLYRELSRLHREDGMDFSRVVVFDLDEYIGLDPGHPGSFHAYMRRNFLDHVNLREQNIHLLDGRPREDYSAYCKDYERAIAAAGGIDLQILGIGKRGHIGFNEPGSSLASRTRVQILARETVEANRQPFGESERVPEAAVTMGLGTILEARRILLLASGESKAHAIAKAVEGSVSASLPASALQLHPDVTVIVDKDAARELQEREHYRRVLELISQFAPGRLL